MPAAHADGGSCEIGKTNYVTDTPWTEAALGMDAVRSLADGDGITVAVVDSGVDTSNPHLAGTAVLPGVNLVGDGATDGRTDNYGHGTVVAGIIAARQVEGSALVGIAPKATILPVRVYDTVSNESSHSQGGPSPQMLAKGIRYAADHGAQIINVSQSTVTADDGLRSAVTYAQGKGSLIVASAGNRNTSSSTQDAPATPPLGPTCWAWPRRIHRSTRPRIRSAARRWIYSPPAWLSRRPFPVVSIACSRPMPRRRAMPRPLPVRRRLWWRNGIPMRPHLSGCSV